MMRNIALVCVLTFVHYVGAQMRGPVLSLYAAAHGATPTGVGLIAGAHMIVAALGSIPLGRASDVWGRRPLILGAMGLGVVTSLLLPLFEGQIALLAIYGMAGVGIAAFTPSALSLVGDAAPPSGLGRAYAWYSTAHYGAIAIGPFVGGLVAEWWGYRAAFVGSAVGIGIAVGVGVGLGTPVGRKVPTGQQSRVRFADVRSDPRIWAGWIVSVSGLLIQGVVFTFFPLLAHERGLTPAGIGLVFLVLGLANTLARVPAGWLVDRGGRASAYAIGGILAASLVTVGLPHANDQATLLSLVAVFGGLSGIAFVAISAGLAASTTPATRGLVMGVYSTCLYLGLAIGSFAFGPVITHGGYAAGFTAAGIAGAVGTLVAGVLWWTSRLASSSNVSVPLALFKRPRRSR
jgi:MFS family permease